MRARAESLRSSGAVVCLGSPTLSGHRIIDAANRKLNSIRRLLLGVSISPKEQGKWVCDYPGLVAGLEKLYWGYELSRYMFLEIKVIIGRRYFASREDKRQLINFLPCGVDVVSYDRLFSSSL